jgi:hypothetical protein
MNFLAYETASLQLLTRAALVSTLLTSAGAAEPIPAARRTDWTYTGVPGGIPQRTNVCATLVPGSTAGQVNHALSACSSAGGGVVLLAAGTYDITGIQVYANNVTLRGAGAGRTILRGSSIVRLGTGYNLEVAIALTGGGAKDSKSFSVQSTTGLAVGQMIELERDDDPDFVKNLAVTGESRSLRQVNRISAIAGNQITVVNPLFIDYTTGRPEIHQLFVSTAFSGIEDLTLDHSTSSAAGVTNVNYCYACWIKGVESSRPYGYHFVITATLNFEVRDSYVHEARTYGPNNAGLAFYGNARYGSNSNAKIENNIFDRLSPAVELQNGSSGFYIGYNYFHGSGLNHEGTGVTWTMADNHGPHDMMNLWEGNTGEMFGSDGYFGGSSHGTVFRNYITGVNPRGGVGNPIILNRLSYYYNIVGNVLGSDALAPGKYVETADSCAGRCDAIYRLGYPNIGNSSLTDATGNPAGLSYPDVKVASTLLRWGNYDYYFQAARWAAVELPAGVPIPGNQSLVHSHHYASRPTWFPASVAWPLIGPDVTGGNAVPSGHVNKSPAQLCWENSRLETGSSFNAAACYGPAPAAPANLKVM